MASREVRGGSIRPRDLPDTGGGESPTIPPTPRVGDFFDFFNSNQIIDFFDIIVFFDLNRFFCFFFKR